MWWIHVDIWQNQYNIVKLKNKIKLKKNKKTKKQQPATDMCGIPEGPVIKTESTGVGKGALFLPEIYFQ